MLIPTDNYLVADNAGGTNLFNSSSSSVCIPSIPADELSFIHPHQYSQATTAAHRRERRINNAPYPMQAPTATSNNRTSPGAAGVHDTDAFIFPGQLPLHVPEPLPAHNSLVNPFAQNMNQFAQMMAFAPGAHGTILDPFTTNPNADNTYANFGELTATHIACMAAAKSYALGNGDAGGTGSRSATPNAADHNRRMFEGQTGQHTTMHGPSKASNAHIKVPQVPQVPSMPPTQPHVPPSAPFAAQNVPYLAESSAHGNIHVHQQYPHTESIKTFPTPSELMAQAAARQRKEMEAPVREAEVADKIRKAHKVEALRQGYTSVDPSVTIS